MKFANVEIIAEFGFRFRADFFDFELANHIGGRLTGPDDIAVNFCAHIAFRIRDIIEVILNGLFAVPFFRVNTGVDNKARGAEDFHAQLSKLFIRIRI